MSKKPAPRRRPSLLSPMVTGRPVSGNTKGKRRDVSVGDLVTIHSPVEHYSGRVMEVVQVIDKDAVVVRSVGAGHAVYDGALWVALTYKPQGTVDGESLEYARIYIRKVVYRRNPEPKPVKQPEVTVLEGTAALLEELASPDPVGKNTHVVYIPDSEDVQL